MSDPAWAMVEKRHTTVYDTVTEEFVARQFTQRKVGSPVTHQFPRDAVRLVGVRLGEGAWTAFSDNIGIPV